MCTHDGESTAWGFECFTLKQQNRVIAMVRQSLSPQMKLVDARGPWAATTARIEINCWHDDTGEFCSLTGKVAALQSNIRELGGVWENGRYDGCDPEILRIALRHPEVAGIGLDLYGNFNSDGRYDANLKEAGYFEVDPPAVLDLISPAKYYRSE